jgi:hypothetical protein
MQGEFSLNDLMTRLEQDYLTQEEADDLYRLIAAKVDGCAEFVSKLDFEAKRLKGVAKEFSEAAKAEEAKLERFRKYVVFCLGKAGDDRIDGERFTLKLKENPGRLELSEEPDPADATAWPELVRIKYEWDKEAIKRKLNYLDIPFARIIRDKKPIFEPKRLKI